VIADHATIETPRNLLNRFTHIFGASPLPVQMCLLPFLSILIPHTPFQEFIADNARKDSRCGDGRKRGPVRVLIAASDNADFPSYYSRPAASVAGVCTREGCQTLIVTNPIASPIEFSRRGFERIGCRKLVLTERWRTWKEVLLLRGHIIHFTRRVPKGATGANWGLACQLLKEKMITRAYSMAGAMTLFDDLFTRFLPNVVVAIPDSSYFGIAAVAVARKKKVPSLTTLAGQIFDHPQYGFLNADSVAVNGDSTKELYVSRGISPSRVFVTGMAHYDDTFRLAKSLPRSREKSESKVIVFATENLPLSETSEMILSVASAALAIPQARVVIRPHPRENPSNYTDLVRRYNSDRITVDSTTPLLELLSQADLVVTGFSNVAIEAMILQRPVICMNLSGKPDKLPYSEEGAALGVHHPDEVGHAIMKALFDEKTKTSLRDRQTAYLKNGFSTTTGDASLRIAELIKELAKRSANVEQNGQKHTAAEPSD
jgi:glycosyltransferase involved in cell wall biosynthesis